MKSPGNLYIVATPIGNLADITARALEALSEVDVIAAEDTRHSRRLLAHFGIRTPLIAHHQHNQSKSAGALVQRLTAGESIALICDAGTPLISDPGAHLVKAARGNGIRVIPIPGASALSSALSVCGLELRRFHFEGFLPARQAERIRRLKELKDLDSGLVFFEAPHRIAQSLEDMAEALGENRDSCVAREMTKLHEGILHGALGQLAAEVRGNAEALKGEFVVIVGEGERSKSDIDDTVERALMILAEETSPRKAAEIASRIFDVRRNPLYRRILEMQSESDDGNLDSS